MALYCAWPETALLAKCEDRACQGTIAEKSAILTDVGCITTLNELGLDVKSRDLQSYRDYFASMKVEDYNRGSF